ncbi:PspC domain-containing protein [Virgibacillus halodenitrificans]|uniref:PspC domain-containing protein n=1 Tax=Virgibacillus halodenitrificans TaxID=1482 RepID=A0ABR7VNI1_VIRHA|nr:PspC domain-containing protein [Virgibacillus halodenitrificans]MBD1222082.1 PspC domain-containing protein [Virgibacillus halodenitrificans]MCG1028840.1 PspC domain-containing protein [Virgibacillus halodenitrificans]MEC2158880.1 PspC domain-containing protein [Virgibacillus halodenitrificans]MYL45713.1 PspC domain-containing protein [Virgibacillus halodenitrificans]WHX28193.1 PspC domain-containing protein [Virgibacillus halodenitrificans]
MQNKLRKSSTDRSIAGVCGGIAEFFGISSFGVRILFIILPANLLIYIILANTIPDSPPSL